MWLTLKYGTIKKTSAAWLSLHHVSKTSETFPPTTPSWSCRYLKYNCSDDWSVEHASCAYPLGVFESFVKFGCWKLWLQWNLIIAKRCFDRGSMWEARDIWFVSPAQYLEMSGHINLGLWPCNLAQLLQSPKPAAGAWYTMFLHWFLFFHVSIKRYCWTSSTDVALSKV